MSGHPAAEPGKTPTIVIVLVVVALVVTLGAIATGFVIASRVGDGATATGPLAVPAVPAPGAEGENCAALMAALPQALGDHQRRPLLVDEPGVAAWGNPAIVLRCGLSDPAELTCAANLTKIINPAGESVEWLRTASDTAVTYLAVDRPVRIAVTVPDAAGIEPVQLVSNTIEEILSAQPVCQGGVLTPVDNS